MTTYTLEQLEILEMLAWADDPVPTAIQARVRWRSYLAEAQYALGGKPFADTGGWILKDPASAEGRAAAVLAALNEWIHIHAI